MELLRRNCRGVSTLYWIPHWCGGILRSDGIWVNEHPKCWSNPQPAQIAAQPLMNQSTLACTHQRLCEWTARVKHKRCQHQQQFPADLVPWHQLQGAILGEVVQVACRSQHLLGEVNQHHTLVTTNDLKSTNLEQHSTAWMCNVIRRSIARYFVRLLYSVHGEASELKTECIFHHVVHSWLTKYPRISLCSLTGMSKGDILHDSRDRCLTVVYGNGHGQCLWGYGAKEAGVFVPVQLRWIPLGFNTFGYQYTAKELSGSQSNGTR